MGRYYVLNRVNWGDGGPSPLGLVVLRYLMRAMSSARRLLLLASLTTLISACGAGESNVVTGNRDGVLHYGNGTEPQGLDPHVVTGVPENHIIRALFEGCLLYTSPSPRDKRQSRMPSSA